MRFLDRLISCFAPARQAMEFECAMTFTNNPTSLTRYVWMDTHDYIDRSACQESTADWFYGKPLTAFNSMSCDLQPTIKAPVVLRVQSGRVESTLFIIVRVRNPGASWRSSLQNTHPRSAQMDTRRLSYGEDLWRLLSLAQSLAQFCYVCCS